MENALNYGLHVHFSAVADYNEIHGSVNLSPTNMRGCVLVTVVDDEAVELSETITMSLSGIRVPNTLHISQQPVNVDVTDDDGK